MTEYPYACRQCGHTFTEESFRDRHEREWHGLDPDGDESESDDTPRPDPSAGREVRKRQRLRRQERDTKAMHPYR